MPIAALDGDRDKEHENEQRALLEKREEEEGLENERPCVFKSLAPVSSPIFYDGILWIYAHC